MFRVRSFRFEQVCSFVGFASISEPLSSVGVKRFLVVSGLEDPCAVALFALLLS
jgi:hypothetical protein